MTNKPEKFQKGMASKKADPKPSTEKKPSSAAKKKSFSSKKKETPQSESFKEFMENGNVEDQKPTLVPEPAPATGDTKPTETLALLPSIDINIDIVEKKKTERVYVKYEFTLDEIVQKATMISTRTNTISALRDELDSIKSQYKSKIENENGLLQELITEVGQKYKMIEKDCEVRMMDPEPGKKSYYDDGVFVKSDTMLPGDYQQAFQFPKTDAPTNGTEEEVFK